MAPSASPAARTVLLLRHAKSSWLDPALDDRDRPLDARGNAAAAAMAVHLSDRPIDAILCSPATRTRQTLAPLLSTRGAGGLHIEPRLYDSSAGTYLALLQDLDDAVRSVLVVGHNPSTEGLCRLLAGSAAPGLLDRIRVKYPTGTLSVIALPGLAAWAALAPGSGQLVEVTRPVDLIGQATAD